MHSPPAVVDDGLHDLSPGAPVLVRSPAGYTISFLCPPSRPWDPRNSPRSRDPGADGEVSAACVTALTFLSPDLLIEIPHL